MFRIEYITNRIYSIRQSNLFYYVSYLLCTKETPPRLDEHDKLNEAKT